jgi:hypothetical protein
LPFSALEYPGRLVIGVVLGDIGKLPLLEEKLIVTDRLTAVADRN